MTTKNKILEQLKDSRQYQQIPKWIMMEALGRLQDSATDLGIVMATYREGSIEQELALEEFNRASDELYWIIDRLASKEVLRQNANTGEFL